jgi:hypothetical protein
MSFVHVSEVPPTVRQRRLLGGLQALPSHFLTAADICFGSKADVKLVRRQIRFCAQSGRMLVNHASDYSLRLLRNRLQFLLLADSGSRVEMAMLSGIPTLERTMNGRRSMRSIADALEAFRNNGHLVHGSLVEIRTSPLPSLTHEAPSIVLVVCHHPSEEPWGVALPTSWEFTGRPHGTSTPETFEISRLDRAKVDEDGTVTLSDGTHLRAVDVVPAALPWELTELRSLRSGLQTWIAPQIGDTSSGERRITTSLTRSFEA